MNNQKLVPLKRLLKCQRLSRKYYIKLAHGLVKCLMYMHELGLVQANFSIDDVLVEITPSVSILMKMLLVIKKVSLRGSRKFCQMVSNSTLTFFFCSVLFFFLMERHREDPIITKSGPPLARKQNTI